MKTFATIAAAAVAVVAAGLAQSPATAQPAADAPVVIVRHGDLDLSTRAGRATLDLRLLHAARIACGTPSPADPRGHAALADCVAETRAAAAAQVGEALAQARRGSSPVLAAGR
jgi:UrcA family protein